MSADPQRRVGDMVVTSRHTLRKAQKAGTDQFDEIGTSGLRQYGGFVVEEWLQQLAGRRAAWAYREMMDNDPVVGAILFAIEMLARKVDMRVEPGNDTDAAEFVESCMDDMSHTWDDFVSEALSMLGYGWAYHELVYKRRSGAQPHVQRPPDDYAATEESTSSTPASSKYTDGRIGWRKIPVRAQETLLRWHFDGYSGVQAMQQIDYHGGNHVIPIEKALLFRTSTKRNNPEGRSVLRNAFTSYYRLKNIQTIEAIGIERDLAGIPMMTPPEGIDPWQVGNEAILAQAQKLVTSVRRDEYEGIVKPFGWEFELVSSAGSRQINTDDIVRRYEQRIATSVLADFILIGQDAVGSFAMVDVKADLFGIALDAILGLICEVLNRYAIPRLLALNGMDISEPPKIVASSAGRIDLDKVGNFFYQLAGSGAPIPWSRELIEQLFSEAGLPANFDEQPEDGESQAPEATAPSSGFEQAPAAPQPDQAGAQPLTKSQEGRGAMVALYPHPDVAHALAVPGGEPADQLHLTLAYLGDAADLDDQQRQQLHDAVSWWATGTPPLDGNVGGAGMFTHGPEPVAWAAPDVPELPEHRQRLVRALANTGAPADRTHGYTPHITLRYGQGDLPKVNHHPLTFTHATLKIGDQRHDFPLTGPAPIAKAERTETSTGTVVHVGPKLAKRHQVMSAQLEHDMHSAFQELGDKAAHTYLIHAQSGRLSKAQTRLHQRQRLISRVLQALNLRQWIKDHLQPLLANHAVRTLADTQRTLQTEIGLEVGLGEQTAQKLIDETGSKLTAADIEPQIRQAIMDAIQQGLDAGEHPVKTARRIQDMVPAGRFVNAGPKYRAQLIARNETARVQRATTLAAYQANPNVIAIRLRDGVYGPPRSDSECMARDGKEVPIAQAGTVHPYHPLCTLSFEPVVARTLVPSRPPEPVPALAA